VRKKFPKSESLCEDRRGLRDSGEGRRVLTIEKLRKGHLLLKVRSRNKHRVTEKGKKGLVLTLAKALFQSCEDTARQKRSPQAVKKEFGRKKGGSWLERGVPVAFLGGR